MIRYTRHKRNIDLKTPIDPKVMPGTGETAEERWAHCMPLFDTAGQQYVEQRGIPAQIAHDAGVRFDPDWNGRPAVVAPMRGLHQELCSVHGRYLHQTGNEDKMFTLGPGGGILNLADAWNNDVVIIVEGLFDVLSLAVCGYTSLATVGRVAPWLPQVCKGKTIILAFDGNRPGATMATFYRQFLDAARFIRLTPPGHSKDWNSALLKKGKATVEQWLRLNLKSLESNVIAS